MTPETVAPFLATTQSPSTIGLANEPVKLSPDLEVLVEIVELVQTEIGVPAASVKTRGGAGGATAAEDGTVPGFDELPEDEAAGLPPEFAAAGLAATVEPSAPVAGEAAGLAVVATLLGEVAFCEPQPLCVNSKAALNKESRKILTGFDLINPP